MRRRGFPPAGPRNGGGGWGCLPLPAGRPARALTVAGSDSGGGAGIQADLKTFAAFGVFGMSALTAVTAQNTLGVQAACALAPSLVAAQIASVRDDIGVDAVKTGMLANAAIVRTVAAAVRAGGLGPLILDPVMVSKGNVPLLEPEAMAALRQDLLPLAEILTPNLPEAAALLGCDVGELRTVEARRRAAAELHALGPRHVLLKGGHASDPAAAVDLWYDGLRCTELRGPRIQTRHTHGTGCTLSAAICAGLARGMPLGQALEAAKDYVTWAIAHAPGLGAGHGPLCHARSMAPFGAERG